MVPPLRVLEELLRFLFRRRGVETERHHAQDRGGCATGRPVEATRPGWPSGPGGRSGARGRRRRPRGRSCRATSTWGSNASATSVTSLRGTANRCSRPLVGGRFSKATENEPRAPVAGIETWIAFSRRETRSDGLALVERHVRVEATVQGDERAREQREDADVGDHEAGVVRLPRPAAHHHREDVDAEEGQEEREGGRHVDVPLDGGGPVLHLVEGRPRAGRGEREHDRHGQAQRGQDFEDTRGDRLLLSHGHSGAARRGTEAGVA